MSTEQSRYSYQNYNPRLHDSVFVAAGARIIGDVAIGENSSVWFNTVLRGDIACVRIGKYTNVQDNCTIHVGDDCPAIVDDYVTIGHGAIIHGSHVHDNCLIGMGAILLNDSEIGENSIIAAGTLIAERKIIPAHSLVMGSPGKVVRQITAEEVEKIRWSALKYSEEARNYLQCK